jgi:outer membrane lipoprotein-sorting protein
MKKFILGLFLLAGATAVAQPKGMGNSDADAKKVLDGVSAKFRSFKTVTAKFNLKIENAAGKVQGSKTGTVNMKGTKYRISVPGEELYSDGVTSWSYDKSSNEVQMNKVDASAAAITPQKLFTNFYDKDFLYKLNGQVKKGKKITQEVELTPIDKTKPFFKVLVNIDKTSQVITSTKVFEKNGNRYTYSVLSMKTNVPLPDPMFVFDATKYPKVEVVDLR